LDATHVRRLAAELVGTAMLVTFGPGAVVAAVSVARGPIDYAALGMVALAFAIVVAAAVYAFGTTSGAHINPAVSVSLAATGRFPWREVPFYVAAQLVGAVGGGLLVVVIYGKTASKQALVGATVLAPDVTYWRGIGAEAIGTFLLLTVVMALAVDRRAPTGWAGLMIGLAVAAEILLIGPATGGSVNPARTFGPYVVSAMLGASVPWSQLWLYIIGPLIGGVVAAVSYDALTRPEGRMAIPRRQGTQGPVTASRQPVPPQRPS
jgi:glycerol uptake facilitator protein